MTMGISLFYPAVAVLVGLLPSPEEELIGSLNIFLRNGIATAYWFGVFFFLQIQFQIISMRDYYPGAVRSPATRGFSFPCH